MLEYLKGTIIAAFFVFSRSGFFSYYSYLKLERFKITYWSTLLTFTILFTTPDVFEYLSLYSNKLYIGIAISRFCIIYLHIIHFTYTIVSLSSVCLLLQYLLLQKYIFPHSSLYGESLFFVLNRWKQFKQSKSLL